MKMCNANGNGWAANRQPEEKLEIFTRHTTAYTVRRTCTTISISIVIIIQHFIYFIISDLGNTVLTTQQTEQENEHARKSCQDENTYREQMISICDTDMCERQTLPI